MKFGYGRTVDFRLDGPDCAVDPRTGNRSPFCLKALLENLVLRNVAFSSKHIRSMYRLRRAETSTATRFTGIHSADLREKRERPVIGTECQISIENIRARATTITSSR